MEDIRELFENDGGSYEVIDFISPDRIRCWNKSNKTKSDSWVGMTGINTEVQCLVNLQDIDLELLKSMKVYAQLDDITKDRLERHIRVKKDETKELMAKARANRKSKFANIPKEITCSKCLKVVESIPSKIASICNKKNILLVDYLASFLCKGCSPVVRRGKQTNPLYAHLPKIMKCECGNETTANFTQLKAKADKLGTTVEDLIKGYKCQSCEKTPRGRKKVVKE